MIDWRRYAACTDIPTESFFLATEETRETEIAVSICGRCPVRRWCLSAALRAEQSHPNARYGIWGGATPAERKRLWRKMQSLQAEKARAGLCSRGLHRMDPDNVYVYPNGGRECRQCRRINRMAAAAQKRRETVG